MELADVYEYLAAAPLNSAGSSSRLCILEGGNQFQGVAARLRDAVLAEGRLFGLQVVKEAGRDGVKRTFIAAVVPATGGPGGLGGSAGGLKMNMATMSLK